MRNRMFVVTAVLLALAFATLAFAASRGTMDLKAGDEVYACNCGDDCPCNTMSRNAGKCTCGKDMVKAKATKVEDGKAYLKAEKWEKERAFKTKGQYACACPPDCKCDTLS